MFEHSGRLLYVESPLGEDTLHLEAFEGAEAFSKPFEYRLDLLSSDEAIDAAAIVGKGMAFQVTGDDGALSTWHGVVRRFVGGGLHPSGLRSYQAILVPWTWFLTKRSNCRIFQNLKVDEVVAKVFEEAGYSDFEIDLQGTYPSLEYCVQFRETDFEFVSRLLEEEGIFYFFKHKLDRHVLMIGDAVNSYSPCKQKSVEYSEGTLKADAVSQWVHGYDYVSGRWSGTDYDFTKPDADLYSETATVLKLGGAEAMERFEYPGRYADRAHGDAKTKAWIEAEEASHEVVQGSSACYSFCVAGTFKLEAHAFPSEEGREYAITQIQHSARDDSFVQSGGGGSFYSNSFACIPKAAIFRPQRETQRPVVFGPQTALVVGPDGEEIHTDKYGRIKVQFHWDRAGERNEKSSCWVRVAQVWAGNKWGFQQLPRIGQEVVVDFLDGDPDRPLVTGSVFNANNMPIHDLPANKTQSGLKTRSSKGGGVESFNELRFEDKKGEEHIFIHAQKDEHHRVVASYFESVGGARHRMVGGDSFIKLEGERHFTLSGDQFELCESNVSLDVAADRKVAVGGEDHLEVKGDKNTKVGGAQSVDVGGAQQFAAASCSRDASGDINDRAGANFAAEGKSNVHIKGGMNVVIEAGMQLTLKAGAGFITIGPAGVDISGPMVKVNSGGAAGAGGGCSPDSPAAPAPPDLPEDPVAPMDKISGAKGKQKGAAPKKGKKASVEWVTPQAGALRSASANGAAFCPT
ncbi:type VI secretion system tip protein VgrG [bacterium]|nr:type VI secretion system tip protein VgrG [bacterium]